VKLAIALILLALAMLRPAAGLAGQTTAAEILEKVSATYKNLKSFHFVGTSLDYPYSQADLAESRPGKVRLHLSGSQDDFLLVSNGETTWTFLVHRNKYTAVASAPLFDEVWEPSPDSTDDVLTRARAAFLYPYMDLGWFEGHAKLTGEKELKIAGNRVNCYVLASRAEDFTNKLWVEKDNYVVLQDDGFKFKRAEVGPLPDKDFNFVPPKKAKQVDSFGRLSRWEEGQLFGLPGLDYHRRVKGDEAPDFTLPGVKGKTVMLVFWTSWCKPCRRQLADIQKLNQELGPKGLVVLGFDDEDGETVEKFFKANGYSFPTLLDPNHAVHEAYGVTWAPTEVIIGRNGKIAAYFIGARRADELRSAVTAAGLKEETRTNPL
jgi:peroxiredoxin/outer membrane lipoprotein-sorting protein